MKRAVFTILLVLVLDQALKVWIKTHMFIGQEIPVLGDWFIIHFTENEGMAFGLKFGIPAGKLILSLFRIVALGVIGWYLLYLTRHQASKSLIISISLIFAGALGNIIDSAFYGLIFSDSYFQVAQAFPPEGGYSTFLHGKVVDMFYFPIIQSHYPSWFPFWANETFIFFRPVFNIADASITTGVMSIILFQGTLFHKKPELSADTAESSLTSEEEPRNPDNPS